MVSAHDRDDVGGSKGSSWNRRPGGRLGPDDRLTLATLDQHPLREIGRDARLPPRGDGLVIFSSECPPRRRAKSGTRARPEAGRDGYRDTSGVPTLSPRKTFRASARGCLSAPAAFPYMLTVVPCDTACPSRRTIQLPLAAATHMKAPDKESCPLRRHRCAIDPRIRSRAGRSGQGQTPRMVPRTTPWRLSGNNPTTGKRRSRESRRTPGSACTTGTDRRSLKTCRAPRSGIRSTCRDSTHSRPRCAGRPRTA